jgi:hypothetical protein
VGRGGRVGGRCEHGVPFERCRVAAVRVLGPEKYDLLYHYCEGVAQSDGVGPSRSAARGRRRLRRDSANAGAPSTPMAVPGWPLGGGHCIGYGRARQPPTAARPLGAVVAAT